MRQRPMEDEGDDISEPCSNGDHEECHGENCDCRCHEPDSQKWRRP
jgi:hypothetical protein